MVARLFGDDSKIETLFGINRAFPDSWGWRIVGDLENGGRATA